MSELRLRAAARAIVIDEEDRVLLVRFDFPGGRRVWATVGGGLEDGETHEDAVRRELKEEAGLADVELGTPVWKRTHVFELGIQWNGQTELYFLVRTTAFEPRPQHSWAQLNAEGVTEIRWWTCDEIEQSEELFAPSRLGRLLRELLQHGPSSEPIDVGV